MRLTSPHNILSAYSRGDIGSGEAIARLGLDGYRDLVVAMADAGHAMPKPSEADVAAQVHTACALLRSVLIPEAADA